MDVKLFSECFPLAVLDKNLAPEGVPLTTPLPRNLRDVWNDPGEHAYTVRVGPYLHFRQAGAYKPSLWVTPASWVVDEITARMLLIERDEISFEMIEFPEHGVYHLYAHYNLILGSRLICHIQADSVPA